MERRRRGGNFLDETNFTTNFKSLGIFLDWLNIGSQETIKKTRLDKEVNSKKDENSFTFSLFVCFL